jgi:hypothetical protein
MLSLILIISNTPFSASDSVFDWDTGRWSFDVHHFSRYGLNVDDSDEDEMMDDSIDDGSVWIILRKGLDELC